jgi:hypothetical protein
MILLKQCKYSQESPLKGARWFPICQKWVAGAIHRYAWPTAQEEESLAN